MGVVVYRHLRKSDGLVFYIGIGVKNRPYKFGKFDRNLHWHRIVEKHGVDVEIVADNLSWKDACELECLLIKEYGRVNNTTGILCNMTEGGEGALGYKHTNECKLRMSKLKTGTKASKEARSRMSKAGKGKKKPHGFSEKLRKANLGKTHSAGTKKKIGLSSSERRHSSESKKERSERMIGHEVSSSTKAKISKNHRGLISVVDTSNGNVYRSISDAAKDLKLNYKVLSAKLKGTKRNNTTLKYKDGKI